MSDRNVEIVRAKLLMRSERGLEKYGATTERTDLDLAAWISHAQEEAMDFAVYAERILQELIDRRSRESAAIADLERENRLLRARNERLEREMRELVERVAQRLEQSGKPAEAGMIRAVFLTEAP